MIYTCPVCGYDQLEYPPEDYNICPSCGTEFGYHDANHSYAELRQRWIANGARWWDPDTSAPAGWSPIAQLRNLDYQVTESDRAAIAQAPQQIGSASA